MPRNNQLYQELSQLKNLFFQVATALDRNHDVIAERMENMDPLVTSIAEWQGKIDSLLKIEDTLNSGASWQQMENIVADIEQTAEVIDPVSLQEELGLIEELLTEINNTQLPVVLNQLEYIQESLPDLQEKEIIETINLIDDYIAGQVIPGEQIQIIIKGQYSEKELTVAAEKLVKNPAVTFYEYGYRPVTT